MDFNQLNSEPIRETYGSTSQDLEFRQLDQIVRNY